MVEICFRLSVWHVLHEMDCYLSGAFEIEYILMRPRRTYVCCFGVFHIPMCTGDNLAVAENPGAAEIVQWRRLLRVSETSRPTGKWSTPMPSQRIWYDWRVKSRKLDAVERVVFNLPILHLACYQRTHCDAQEPISNRGNDA